MADSDASGKVPIRSLAKQIQAEHEAAERDIRSALSHAVRAGELLIEAKAKVKHGEWGAWLAENFEFSQQWAAGYMRLAKADPAQIESAVSVRGALKELAEPADDPQPESSAPDYVPRVRCPVCNHMVASDDIGVWEGDEEVNPGEPCPLCGWDAPEAEAAEKPPTPRRWITAKEDRWDDFAEPLAGFAAAAKRRDYDFSHLNWKQAKKRIAQIDRFAADLQKMREALEPRAQRAKLSFDGKEY